MDFHSGQVPLGGSATNEATPPSFVNIKKKRQKKINKKIIIIIILSEPFHLELSKTMGSSLLFRFSFFRSAQISNGFCSLVK